MKKNIFNLITVFIILNSSFLILSCPCQWVRTNGPNAGNNSCIVFKDNILFAGTYSGGVYRTTNNGLNWVSSGITSHPVISLYAQGANLFAGTYNGGIFLSTNNGVNWTNVNNGLSGYALQVRSIISINSILLAGTAAGVFKSTNNGANWTVSSSGFTNTNILLLKISGTNIYAGTNQGAYVSTNNGASWASIGLQDWAIPALEFMGNNIFAAAFINVFMSSNNGMSWIAVSSGLNGKLVNYFAVSGNTLIAGTSEGVYLTTNMGTLWQEQNLGFTIIPSVYSLKIANDYIFAGTSNYVWRRFLTEIVYIENISIESPSEFMLGQNYPNPFNSVTSLKFKIPAVGQSSRTVTIKIFDLLGREIKTLVNEKLNPGTYEVRFDAGNMPSGIYFYRMESEKFSDTKNLILLK